MEQRVTERTIELVRVNQQLEEEVLQRQQIENILRQSESQLRAILDSLPIPIVVVSDQNTVLYVNPVFASLFDSTRQSSADYHILDMFADTVDKLALQELLERQGYVRSYEITFRTIDDSPHFGLVSIQPFQFDRQSTFLASLVEITELKRTQEAEREQRKLMEALLDSAMALTSTLQLDDVVKHLLRSLYQVVPHDVANVMIVDGEEATVLGSRDYIAGSLDYTLVQTRFLYKDHYFGNLMATTHQPVIVGDITNDSRFLRIAEGPILRGYLGTPIIVGQELIGFLSSGIAGSQLLYRIPRQVSANLRPRSRHRHPKCPIVCPGQNHRSPGRTPAISA